MAESLIVLEDSEDEPNYNRENDRLNSFQKFNTRFSEHEILAKIGFYAKSDSVVLCFFCQLILNNTIKIDYIEFHFRYSPKCILMRKKSLNNQPIDQKQLDDLIPDTYSDYCGSYANTTKIKVSYPNFQYYSVRLESFKDWPKSNLKPSKLAQAGFFYTNKSDKVICFSCKGGLQSWKETNDPWEMHALYYSYCEYVRIEKGPEYINEIRKSNGKEILELLDLPKEDNLQKTEKEDIASTINLERICKICKSRSISILFLPCSDAVSCENCSKELKICTKCGKEIQKKVKIYF